MERAEVCNEDAAAGGCRRRFSSLITARDRQFAPKYSSARRRILASFFEMGLWLA